MFHINVKWELFFRGLQSLILGLNIGGESVVFITVTHIEYYGYTKNE